MTDRLRPSLGRAVFSAADAGRLGDVKEVIVDQPPRRIVALQVSGSKRSATVVDWANVTGFGPDAVIVEGPGALRDASGDREIAITRRSISLLGTRIVDSAGFGHGTVTEVSFDPVSGELVEVEGGDERWPAHRLRALGTFALVVDPN